MRCVECQVETDWVPCGHCRAEPRVGGRYALMEQLDRRPGGAVYRGRDVRTGDPVRVEEVLLGTVDGDTALAAAQEAASVLRLLHHPGLPRWRDEVQLGSGRAAALYLVEDHVEGERLTPGALLGDDRERRVLELLFEVASALDHMHHNAPPIVHGDVGLGSLVRRSDGSVALVGAGAARSAMNDACEGVFTDSDQVGFRAPELVQGPPQPASDLYALGMVGLVLLTGLPAAVLCRHGGPPEVEGLPGLSPATARLLKALLRPDPELRPRSAAIVRHHIRTMVDADHCARADTDISPTLVPFSTGRFDTITGLRPPLIHEHTSLHDALGGVPGAAASTADAKPLVGRLVDAARAWWSGEASAESSTPRSKAV